MDLDVGKTAATEPATIPTLDGWIESLMNCKQLAESDVQRLCDRVRAIMPWDWLKHMFEQTADNLCSDRLERSCKKSRTYSLWYA